MTVNTNHKVNVDISPEALEVAKAFVETQRRYDSETEDKKDTLRFRIKTRAGTDICIPGYVLNTALIVGSISLIGNLVIKCCSLLSSK
jgi:hypothetical protein